MNKPFTSIITIGCAAVISLLMIKCQSRGINFADMEHSDQQKKFEKRLMAQQHVLDSLGKVYKDRPMIVNSFPDFNGEPKKILVSHPSGYKIIDTLKPGDTVQLIEEFPIYRFRPDSIVQVLRTGGTIIKTKKGKTGVINYYFIEQFKMVLKEKGLETDTV